ncbi:MAG: NADH-quinone oxidoreductase subunit NuoB [Candidatus Aenigmarchaeota archaeon]
MGLRKSIVKSPWVSYFNSGGCNGCALEVVALITPRYDIERFGAILKSSARHADILIVSGALTEQSRKRLVNVYRQMSPDKKVIAVGICGCSGGPFRFTYNIKKRVDEVIPVDMYVPGCPPRPEAIINAIVKLMVENDGSKQKGTAARGRKGK